jgi:hypothetical protein
MIAILIKGEGLDMYPGTVIQRERLSPFFLSKSSDGKDGIPGEISYPFKLPPSDKNYRLLDWPHILPNVKTKVHTGILENDGMQLSAGRLVMDVIETNLQINNKGFIDAHFLSNASEFFVRIKDKKLKDLSLGGERTSIGRVIVKPFQVFGSTFTIPGITTIVTMVIMYFSRFGMTDILGEPGIGKMKSGGMLPRVMSNSILIL